MRKANDFRDGFLSLGKCAESGWIGISVDLFYELEGDEIEDEGLLIEHDDHHVLA